MIKVYRNNSPFNLSTSVKGKNNKSYLVDFTGFNNGRGSEANKSEFTTDNKDMQEAIEADPRYGKMFTCTSPIEAKKTDSKEVVDSIEVGGETNTSSDITQNAGDSIEVGDVTNTQMAIEWLEINKEHKFSSRPSKADVLSVATSLGVVFTEWK